jgi:hypothetical protein
MWPRTSTAWRLQSRPAGIKRKVGNHSLRPRHYRLPEKGGTLERAQAMANRSSPRTMRLYDRRNDEASPDEDEKMGI